MTLTRQYVPTIGKRVTLQRFEDYTRYAPSVAIWAWFTVRSIQTDTVKMPDGKTFPAEPTAILEHYNTRDTGEMFTVPLVVITPPLGWQARYTIYVEPAKVESVLGWFARGIVVRANHDLGSCMSIGSAFQPMDNSDTPHWRHPEVTDAIPAEECGRVFRVVKVEREEVNETVYKAFDPTCKHCHGSGRRTLAELGDIRHESIAELKRKMTIAPEPYRINESLQLTDYDSETETFECSCHWGSFKKLGRSKRVKLIRQWAMEGWKTEYVPYAGGFWKRTRETVVKDWNQ